MIAMTDILKIYNNYISLIASDTFDFDKFNEYAIVHHSNAIEGSTLTKEETFLLLEEKLTPKNKPLAYSLMAVDHLNALKYVIALADSKKPLNEENIKHISSLIMKQTGAEVSALGGNFDSSKGDFRKVTVRAGTTTFMDYNKVPARVNELLNYINTNIKQVKGFQKINDLAFDAHFQMVSIHPFADGNGRISRLIMNYVQQYHKMPLTAIYLENKQEYFNALQETRKKEDITIFRKFMFSQTKKYLLEKVKELTENQTIKKSNGNGMSFLF
jgi:Fic family protein